MTKIFSKFGEQQLVMVNYACIISTADVMRLFQFCCSQLRSSEDKHTLKSFGIFLTGFFVFSSECMQAGFRGKTFIPTKNRFTYVECS